MTPIEEALLVAGMMAVTFGVRFPVLLLAGRTKLPAALERALNYVPVAVLTAISVPILLKPEGHWFVSLDNAHFVAGLVATATAAFSRHLLLTIGVGMAVFAALQVL